jgi:hypothetical protein
MMTIFCIFVALYCQAQNNVLSNLNIFIIMTTRLVVIPEKNLRMTLLNVLEEYEHRRLAKETEKKQIETLYTVNQVAKRFGRAHRSIKNLISQGLLKTTSDGRISEKSINEYLINT